MEVPGIIKRAVEAMTGGSKDAVRPDTGMPEPGTIPQELQGQEIPTPDQLFTKSQACEARKSKLRRAWKEALAFYAGMQWLDRYVDSSVYDGHWVQSAMSPQSCKASINLWRKKANAVVGLLTAGKPLPKTVAIGIESTDVERARGTDGLLRHMWTLTKHQNVLEDMVLWATLTGNGFYKIYWDPDGGDCVPDTEWDAEAGERTPVMDEATGEPMLDPETGEPVTQATGAMVETGTHSMTGCLVHESIPPFNVGFHDGVPFERSPWVYQRSGYEPEALYDRFGVKCEPDTYPESVDDGGVIRFDVPKQSGEPSMVEVIEWWEKPSRKHPMGLHVISSRKKRLYVGTWEKGRAIPIIHYRALVMPGSPWGVGAGTDAVEPQKVYNSISSDCVMKIATEGDPGWMGTKEQADGAHIEKGPGRFSYVPVINGNDQPPPQQVKLDPMSDANMKLMDKAEDWISKTWGINDVYTGDLSDEDSSGRAISYRVEQTARNFVNAATRLVQVEKDCWTMSLELWREFGPEEETVAVMGADAGTAYKAFRRDEISYRTLDMDESSVLVGSPEAMRQQVERLVAAGIIPPEEGRKYLAMPQFSQEQLDPAADDRSWARRNIERLRNGEPVEPMAHMNFAVHYEVTAAWMKKAEWFNESEAVQAASSDYLERLRQTIVQAQQPAQQPGANGANPVDQATAQSPAGGGGTSTSLPANPSPTTSQVGEPGQGGPGVDATAEAIQRGMS